MNGELEIGIVGLGRMGGGLALQALKKGVKVVGMTAEGAAPGLIQSGLVESRTLSGLSGLLQTPRAIFLYIPAGPAVDATLETLLPSLSAGDVVVDGGNSYWGDSIRRAERLAKSNVHFVDLGTSGGVLGANSGACFMAGGADAAVARIEPVLKLLAVPGGYVHAGPSGAGHFTKLVHNGIEFGMLQAIGEGMALLQRFPSALPTANILGCWRHGSVIRSWLIDLMDEQYRAERGLDDVPSYVDDTGEVNWLVADALRMEVPIPVIAQSVMQLFQSRDGTSAASRAIALMRRGFGGHALGHAPAAEHERRTGRVGEFVGALPMKPSDDDSPTSPKRDAHRPLTHE